MSRHSLALWLLDAFGDLLPLITHPVPHFRARGIYWKTLALVAHDRTLLGTEARGLSHQPEMRK